MHPRPTFYLGRSFVHAMPLFHRIWMFFTCGRYGWRLWVSLVLWVCGCVGLPNFPISSDQLAISFGLRLRYQPLTFLRGHCPQAMCFLLPLLPELVGLLRRLSRAEWPSREKLKVQSPPFWCGLTRGQGARRIIQMIGTFRVY